MPTSRSTGPEVLNAYNWDMVEEIIDVFRRLPEEEGVWAAVLRSAGDRAFCVGTDLKERKTLPMEKVQALRSMLEEAHDRVTFFPKPIVAAVRGYALGGGMGIRSELRLYHRRRQRRLRIDGNRPLGSFRAEGGPSFFRGPSDAPERRR